MQQLFEKLGSFIKNNKLCGYGAILDMIKTTSGLLNAKCPLETCGFAAYSKGYTVMEVCCQHNGFDVLELLYELILLGGKATDTCYQGCFHAAKYCLALDHINILLLSGCIPTKQLENRIRNKEPYFILDHLTEGWYRRKDESGS